MAPDADVSTIVGSTHARRSVPEASVARLATYLRVLDDVDPERDVISSEALAAASGVNSAKLRRDISFLGSFGTRGVGYEVSTLRARIADFLGIAEQRNVVIVGIGNLGHALAGYGGLAARGFTVVGLFDIDQVGERIGDLVVQPVSALRETPGRYAGHIGVIATPADAAQQALDLLVDAGVTSVLNFAPALLSTAEGIDVRRVDLASELQILSFHERRKTASRTSNGAAS